MASKVIRDAKVPRPGFLAKDMNDKDSSWARMHRLGAMYGVFYICVCDRFIAYTCIQWMIDQHGSQMVHLPQQIADNALQT